MIRIRALYLTVFFDFESGVQHWQAWLDHRWWVEYLWLDHSYYAKTVSMVGQLNRSKRYRSCSKLPRFSLDYARLAGGVSLWAGVANLKPIQTIDTLIIDTYTQIPMLQSMFKPTPQYTPLDRRCVGYSTVHGELMIYCISFAYMFCPNVQPLPGCLMYIRLEHIHITVSY